MNGTLCWRQTKHILSLALTHRIWFILFFVFFFIFFICSHSHYVLSYVQMNIWYEIIRKECHNFMSWCAYDVDPTHRHKHTHGVCLFITRESGAAPESLFSFAFLFCTLVHTSFVCMCSLLVMYLFFARFDVRCSICYALFHRSTCTEIEMHFVCRLFQFAYEWCARKLQHFKINVQMIFLFGFRFRRSL